VKTTNLLLAATLLAAPHAALSEEEAVAAAAEPDPSEIVNVYGDRFARWDGTRWYAHLQLGWPLPFVMHARLNDEVQINALDVEATITCEKTVKRGARGSEVHCVIDDISFEGVTFLDKVDKAEPVLAEFDERLTGALLQLQVSDIGRVNNIDLEGLPESNRRENMIKEEARQILSRVMAGFHMKLPARATLREGQWLEYDSLLFALPAIETTRGGSTVIHQLNPYRGHLVVQSVGKGTIVVGGDDNENSYMVSLDGVAIYDKETGIMSERVWAMRGKATASSYLADGWEGGRYFNVGRLQLLAPDAVVDLGPTRRVSPPGKRVAGLDLWVPLP
jgi:hypothetical protein